MTTITDGPPVTDAPAPAPTEDERRAALVAGLRAAADFFESCPFELLPGLVYMRRAFYGDDAKAQLADAARAMGNITKTADEWDFNVTRVFGGGVELVASASRELVCERVQVDTRQVKQQVPKGEVEYKTITVEEPVYEYICPPSLLRPDVEADAETQA